MIVLVTIPSFGLNNFLQRAIVTFAMTDSESELRPRLLQMKIRQDQECENPVFYLFMKMSLNVNLLLLANLSRRPVLIHDSISKIHDTNFHLFHRF